MRVFACTVILIAACVAGFGQAKRGYLRNDGKGANHNMVYIDYDRHSKYYDLVADFNFTPAGLQAYRDGIKLIKGKSTAPFSKKDITGLPLKWCPLLVYQSEPFIYYPANPENNYRMAFNDTTCIEYRADKVTVSQLLSVKKTKDHTYSIVRLGADKKSTTIIVHVVDSKNGMAIFENLIPGVKYTLMAPAQNIHQFEIIVNYSKNHKAPEYPFAVPDLRNIIGKI